MKRDAPEPILDELATLARGQGAPPIDDERIRSLVARAVHDARGKPTHRKARRLSWIAAAILIPSALAGIYWTFASRGPNPGETELRATLPTGDSLTATAGSLFQVESAETEHRRVSLDRGAVLFDVAPLTGSERFEVATGHLTAVVRGTVFSVETSSEQTIVRVYEGRVEVVQDERRLEVVARRMWISNDSELRDMSEGPLAVAGREAARRRALPRPVAPEPPSIVEARDEPSEEHVAVSGGPADRLPERESPRPMSRIVRAPVRPDAGPRRPSSADTPRTEPPVEPPPPTAREVRRWLLEGRLQETLEVSHAKSGGEWRLLEADALRGLGRAGEAAAGYDRAAGELPPARAAQAGYLAATLRFRNLGDPSGALASLDRSRADSASAPLAERATVLRVRALLRLGRQEEARRIAARYLERFPNGGMEEWMIGLVDR